jgi:hypothetical protein
MVNLLVSVGKSLYFAKLGYDGDGPSYLDESLALLDVIF